MTYLKHCKRRLSDLKDYKKSGYYQSLIDDLSLEDFICARQRYCRETHANDCQECCSLIGVARSILEDGIVELSCVFRKYFPQVNYQSSKATRRVMQLPVIVFSSETGSGNQKLFVIEQKNGVDYSQMIYLIQKVVPDKVQKSGVMTKEPLRGLCELASTEVDTVES